MSNSLILTETEQLKQEDSQVVAFAGAYQITDSESVKEADRIFNEYAAKKQQRFDKFDKLRKASYEAYQGNLALLKEAIGPYEKGMLILEKKILAYRSEVKRLQAIADQEATDRKNKEAEEARKAEAEALLKLAETVEKGGDDEQAAALMEEALKVESCPADTTPVQAPQILPKLASTAKKYWYARVPDLMVLVKAVAAGREPLVALMANEVYLNGRARLEEAALNIEGVVPDFEEGLSKGRTRSARLVEEPLKAGNDFNW